MRQDKVRKELLGKKKKKKISTWLVGILEANPYYKGWKNEKIHCYESVLGEKAKGVAFAEEIR